MDSLPQEIIDQIIDNLPHSSLCSTSLVAKRWRKRCQQHAFRRVWFGSESMVDRWHTEIQSNPGGISSYTQFAGFTWIAEWRDPTLFGRVFKNFSSLTTLGIQCITGISGKIFENISHRELCRITTLHIGDLRCSPSTVIAIILAFPNLRDLTVVDHAMEPEEPSTHSAPPQRRPLDSLFIHGRGNGPIAETLADYRFAPRRLTLDAQPQNIQKLLTFSSATIVELQLVDRRDISTSDPIDLPPFPTLTLLRIYFLESSPSTHLITILSSISSVPALTSITLGRWIGFIPEPVPSSNWDHLDRWLVQIGRSATVEGDLMVALTRRQEGRIPEVLLPKFIQLGKITAALPPI